MWGWGASQPARRAWPSPHSPSTARSQRSRWCLGPARSSSCPSPALATHRHQPGLHPAPEARSSGRLLAAAPAGSKPPTERRGQEAGRGREEEEGSAEGLLEMRAVRRGREGLVCGRGREEGGGGGGGGGALALEWALGADRDFCCKAPHLGVLCSS